MAFDEKGQAATKDDKVSIAERSFKILRLNTSGENQKFYVYFKEPSDVRKMAFLVWKNVGGDDDRWLWLPALNLVKRIAPGDKRTSFVGSDFLYEDVSGRHPDQDNHEISKTTDTHWTIKSTPKKPSDVDFSYYETTVDKTTWLPQKATYYDKQGKAYRIVEALKVETIGGYATITQSKASDLKAGTSTINSFSEIEYDLNLNERIFSERFLRRPPKEVR